MTGTNPDCMAVTLPTRNANNVVSTDTKFLTTHDIKNLPACWFPDKTNPLTKKRGTNCVEGFENISNECNETDNPFDELNILDEIFNIKNNNIFKFSDIVAYTYFISLAILFLSLIKVKG